MGMNTVDTLWPHAAMIRILPTTFSQFVIVQFKCFTWEIVFRPPVWWNPHAWYVISVALQITRAKILPISLHQLMLYRQWPFKRITMYLGWMIYLHKIVSTSHQCCTTLRSIIDVFMHPSVKCQLWFHISQFDDWLRQWAIFNSTRPQLISICSNIKLSGFFFHFSSHFPCPTSLCG